MAKKFAVLIDGGFITKVLQKTNKRYPTIADISNECKRIMAHPALAQYELLRFYFYDAPPLQKVITNPLDGFILDLGKSARARESQALQEGLELENDFAVRRGETVFHGWKLGSASVKDLQKNPRTPTAKDFVPDIKQKGVDLRIGLDVARLSLLKLVDTIVVITGDADLAPALKFARREGIRVYLDHLGHSVSRELKVHADLVF